MDAGVLVLARCRIRLDPRRLGGPPRVGVLWTPGYWSKAGTVFVFHPGHWGSTVGVYGGVNYGYGYFGNGYTGGHWIGNSFAYNSAVNHVDAAVAHHIYAQSVPGEGSRGALLQRLAAQWRLHPHGVTTPIARRIHQQDEPLGASSTELAQRPRCPRKSTGRRPSPKRRLSALLRNQLKSLRPEQRQSNNDRFRGCPVFGFGPL